MIVTLGTGASRIFKRLFVILVSEIFDGFEELFEELVGPLLLVEQADDIVVDDGLVVDEQGAVTE
jgi:hypothetical protein